MPREAEEHAENEVGGAPQGAGAGGAAAGKQHGALAGSMAALRVHCPACACASAAPGDLAAVLHRPQVRITSQGKSRSYISYGTRCGSLPAAGRCGGRALPIVAARFAPHSLSLPMRVPPRLGMGAASRLAPGLT